MMGLPLQVLPSRQHASTVQSVRRSRMLPALVLLCGAGLLSCGFVGNFHGNASTRVLHTACHFFGGTPTGQDTPIAEAPVKTAKHFVKGTPMYGPWPEGMEEAMFGMGCFWCSENLYMKMEGVYSSQVGYAGGNILNPSYNDVCTGTTNHNEVVRVVFDPKVVTYAELLKIFWEQHNPTTLNRQGNDRGTQYRSGIYYYNEAQREVAEATKEKFQKSLEAHGVTGKITTEIVPAPKFYYAEDYHQQYDAKPGSRYYCGLSPTGAQLDISDVQLAPA